MESQLIEEAAPSDAAGQENLARIAGQIGVERLLRRWRMLADRIERYSPAAAEAYWQAVTDLEAEMDRHGAREDPLCAFLSAVTHAVRSEIRSAEPGPKGRL